MDQLICFKTDRILEDKTFAIDLNDILKDPKQNISLDDYKDFKNKNVYKMLDIIINDSDDSEINDGNILYQIGYYYDTIIKDYTRAKYYYELAIKQDSSDAMANLGILYRRGCGVEKDYTKAKYYYELAIEQNNDRAMNNLGFLYRHGYGVRQDYTKAKYYYELAIEQNNVQAMCNLGLLYHYGYGYGYGYGVEQDYSKAIYYFNRAVGNNSGIRNLSTLIGSIDIDQLKPDLYYKLNSNTHKRILLNRFYRENRTTPYDPQYTPIFADGIKRGLFNKNRLDEEKLLESYEKYQLSTYKKIKNKFDKHVPLHIASLITDFL